MRSRPYARHSSLFLFWWFRWCIPCVGIKRLRACVQSTETNTLISVVRHLTFIDFIKWSNANQNGSHQTQFSHHQYVTTVSVCLTNIALLTSHHSSYTTITITHDILSSVVVFCACFFPTAVPDELSCLWRMYIIQLEMEGAEKNRIKIGCCSSVLHSTKWHIRITIEWRFLWLSAFSVQKLMAKMIYLNVFTAILHLPLCRFH